MFGGKRTLVWSRAWQTQQCYPYHHPLRHLRHHRHGHHQQAHRVHQYSWKRRTEVWCKQWQDTPPTGALHTNTQKSKHPKQSTLRFNFSNRNKIVKIHQVLAFQKKGTRIPTFAFFSGLPQRPANRTWKMEINKDTQNFDSRDQIIKTNVATYAIDTTLFLECPLTLTLYCKDRIKVVAICQKRFFEHKCKYSEFVKKLHWVATLYNCSSLTTHLLLQSGLSLYLF